MHLKAHEAKLPRTECDDMVRVLMTSAGHLWCHDLTMKNLSIFCNPSALKVSNRAATTWTFLRDGLGSLVAVATGKGNEEYNDEDALYVTSGEYFNSVDAFFAEYGQLPKSKDGQVKNTKSARKFQRNLFREQNNANARVVVCLEADHLGQEFCSILHELLRTQHEAGPTGAWSYVYEQELTALAHCGVANPRIAAWAAANMS